MVPYRYAEAAALVPLLHVAPGPTTVLVSGSLAPLLTLEALRWRDTVKVLTDVPSTIKDSRIEVNKIPPLNSLDVVLLSPEIDPAIFVPLLKKSGIIAASTYSDSKVGPLRTQIKTLTGNAVPYHEFLPESLWLVLGSVGSAPKRVRKPPDGARRVTERFLPAMFSFGKDEIALVFGKEQPG